MTPTRRSLRQAIPLAVVILSMGLGYQYALGGGVFEAESGLMAKAQAMFAELRARVLSVDSSEVDAAQVIASEDAIEKPAIAGVPQNVRIGISSGRRLSSCQH